MVSKGNVWLRVEVDSAIPNEEIENAVRFATGRPNEYTIVSETSDRIVLTHLVPSMFLNSAIDRWKRLQQTYHIHLGVKE